MMNVPYSLPPYHLPELTFHGRMEKCWPIICTSFSSQKGKIIPQVVLNFRREIILPNGWSNKGPGRNMSLGTSSKSCLSSWGGMGNQDIQTLQGFWYSWDISHSTTGGDWYIARPLD
jgi:hypothetical protein